LLAAAIAALSTRYNFISCGIPFAFSIADNSKERSQQFFYAKFF